MFVRGVFLYTDAVHDPVLCLRGQAGRQAGCNYTLACHCGGVLPDTELVMKVCVCVCVCVCQCEIDKERYNVSY